MNYNFTEQIAGGLRQAGQAVKGAMEKPAEAVSNALPSYGSIVFSQGVSPALSASMSGATIGGNDEVKKQMRIEEVKSKYSPKDIAFLKALKDKGYDAKTSFEKLNMVKSKIETQQPSQPKPTGEQVQTIGEELLSPVTQGETMQTQNKLQIPSDASWYEAPIYLAKQIYEVGKNTITDPLKQFGSGVSDIGEGLYKTGKGTIQAAFGDREEGMKTAMEGEIQTAKGAVGAVFSPFAALPAPIKDAIAVPFNSVDVGLKHTLNALGEDPESREGKMWRDGINTLLQTFIAVKYGNKAKKLKEKLYTNPITKESMTGKIGETIAPKIEQPLKSLGERITQSAITPTITEAEQLQNYRAGVSTKKPFTRASVAVQEGISGTKTKIGQEATKKADFIYKKQILPELKKTKEVIPQNEIWGYIEKKIKKIPEEESKQNKTASIEYMKDIYKNREENFALDKAQKIKSNIDFKTSPATWKGKEISASLPWVKHEFANAIRELTYDKLSDIGVKQKYLTLSKLIELKEIGKKALTETDTRSAFGRTIFNILDMAVIPIKTTMGRVIYRIGDLFNLEGKAGATTLKELINQEGIPISNIDQKNKKNKK